MTGTEQRTTLTDARRETIIWQLVQIRRDKRLDAEAGHVNALAFDGGLLAGVLLGLKLAGVEPDVVNDLDETARQRVQGEEKT